VLPVEPPLLDELLPDVLPLPDELLLDELELELELEDDVTSLLAGPLEPKLSLPPPQAARAARSAQSAARPRVVKFMRMFPLSSGVRSTLHLCPHGSSRQSVCRARRAHRVANM